MKTPAWWPELQKVPAQRDTIGFAKQVQAFFQLPQVKCLTWRNENNYAPPPVPHCIEWDAFLPFGNGNIASQYYRMTQPQKTLAYAKALQVWAEEKAQPPWAGQPHQLAACMKELRESMELLMLFTDEEVLTKEPSLLRVKVTSSQPSNPAELETMQEQSHSRDRRACTWGSFPSNPQNWMLKAYHHPRGKTLNCIQPDN